MLLLKGWVTLGSLGRYYLVGMVVVIDFRRLADRSLRRSLADLLRALCFDELSAALGLLPLDTLACWGRCAVVAAGNAG